MGGIVRSSGGILHEIGGIEDHIHLLVGWNPHTPLSDLLRDLKSNSTKWIKATYPEIEGFGWQSGYSAFSVSLSQMERVARYIANQETHHRKMDFREELMELLKAHQVNFEERYLFS